MQQTQIAHLECFEYGTPASCAGCQAQNDLVLEQLAGSAAYYSVNDLVEAEGRDARRRSIGREQNPYAERERRFQWDLGWRTADVEIAAKLSPRRDNESHSEAHRRLYQGRRHE